MYDELTGRYAFSCPARGGVRVPLSAFRTLERLPGPGHPAVYRIAFACPCGEQHDGLVTHEELDWAPLGGSAELFFNVMTARLEPVADELLDRASRSIAEGEWPWSFFCFPEERARPAFPSSFRLLAPGGGAIGVAVRCAACERTSVNLVSEPHVDVPFYNDREVRVVEHVFPADGERTLAAFHEELWSSSFDAARRDLAA